MYDDSALTSAGWGSGCPCRPWSCSALPDGSCPLWRCRQWTALCLRRWCWLWMPSPHLSTANTNSSGRWERWVKNNKDSAISDIDCAHFDKKQCESPPKPIQKRLLWTSQSRVDNGGKKDENFINAGSNRLCESSSLPLRAPKHAVHKRKCNSRDSCVTHHLM